MKQVTFGDLSISQLEEERRHIKRPIAYTLRLENAVKAYRELVGDREISELEMHEIEAAAYAAYATDEDLVG